MAKFTVIIETDNDAFGETHAEHCSAVAQLLGELVNRVDELRILPGETVKLYDVNGNPVGTAGFTED